MPDHVPPSRSAVACLAIATPGDVALVSTLADDLHRRAGWQAPPHILQLAAIAGIRLFRARAEEVLLADRAFFVCAEGPRDQLLWQAHALAGAMLVRAGILHTEPRAWTLGVELVAPTWMPGARRWVGLAKTRGRIESGELAKFSS